MRLKTDTFRVTIADALKGTREETVLEGLLFLIIALSVLVSAYALLLDTYHSYVKSKLPVPKWIVWVVFKLTPPPVLVALGLASKSTAAQIDAMGTELQREKDALPTHKEAPPLTYTRAIPRGQHRLYKSKELRIPLPCS